MLWYHVSTARLVVWFAAALSVIAQSSDVTNCSSTYEWSLNDKGQTPCLVAAYLESACGTPTQVNSLPVDNRYLGPTAATQNPCLCSSVTYFMVSACGGCQSRNFQNWTTWSANCIGTTVTTFPEKVPSTIDVPEWAFLNVTLTGDTLDPVAAQNALKGISPPTLTPASTTTPATAFSDAPSSTSPAVTTTQSSEKSHSNAGAIAGGVVGGLVLLAVIVIAVLWLYMRKRRNSVQQDLTFDSRALISTSPMMSQQTGSSQPLNNGPSPVSFSSPLYGTSMSTFPTSPLTSAVFTTPATGSRRSMESVSQSLAQFGSQSAYAAQHPGYRGAAEI
ncbi:hypothetical protein BDN70DRAFT_923727 [Pholiota conissans]|uniref:Uncharacterized protein n=1 Tax=Pholiota conissans TaxID=109636 RepID=A0A9P6CXR2_9AGAR|nr:hypothetical protein BDN70DRAFT_923727 [Pholiota conissans]